MKKIKRNASSSLERRREKKKKKKKRERERERAKVGVDIIVGDDKRRAKRYETGTEVSLPTNMAAVDLNGQTPKVRSK